jgi:hypothetical protein
MKKFLIGVGVGTLGTIYGYMVKANLKVISDYNQSMTNLFNSVPPEQRYGYDKDFSGDTRWEL